MVQVLETGQPLRFTTLNAALAALHGCHDRGVAVIRSSKEEEFLSYAELYASACYTLANLQRYGVRPGDELMIQVDDSREFLVLFWACLLGGIIAVPLSTGVQDQQKSKVLNVAATLHHPYWVGTADSLDRIRKIAQEGNEPTRNLFAYIEERSLLLTEVFGQHKRAEPLPAEPGQTAYIQFSSGSTGTPKGVVLTHANLMANTCSIIERTGIVATETMLSWMPLTHDMGLICFHLSGVVAGARQYIMPTALFIRTPLLWLEKASEHRANYLYSPNFGLQYALSAFEGHHAPGWNLSAVRCIYNGAEPISADLCQLFMQTMQPYGLGSEVMFPGYGLAEASVAVTLPRPGEPVVRHVVRRQSLLIGQPVEFIDNAAHTDAVTLVEVGFAIPRTEIRIADETDALLPDGMVGHIQIRGENVTRGYYNHAEATQRAFTADGWLRTGDLGFCRRGRLVVTGRLKELIIVNGQNYYPHDIERVAQKVPGVELGKVVATSHWNARLNREEVLLFVLFKKSPDQFVPLAKALRSILLHEVGIVVDKVLPCRRVLKTTSGKIQRFQFIDAYCQGEFDAVWQAIEAGLATDARQELAHLGQADKVRACWQTVMGIPFSETSSVYELGITSLQITQFVARLNQATGTQLTVGEVLQCATLGELTALVTQTEATTRVVIEPTPVQAHYPVTEAQRRLWFTDQYAGGTSAYNIAVGYELNGALDEEILQRAFAQLIERHAILRTVFFEVDGLVRQRIRPHDTCAFGLMVVDATPFTGEQLTASIRAEANYRFDLQQGPLLRVTLFRQRPDTSVLLLVMHHSIADGWSVGQLMGEVTDYYRRTLANQPTALPPLSIQYHDYATWLADQPRSSASLAYWKTQLEPNHPILDFPAYGTRTPVRSRKGETVTHTFETTSLLAVHELARRHNATAFMVLLAMVKATVYRYTGQTDLIVGTDVASRQLDQLTDQIGYFLNTVCVRTTFDAATPLGQLITSVKQQFLAGLAHQDVPFETLLNEINVPNDRSRSPLFDLLVVFQNFEPVPFTPAAHLVQTAYLNPPIDETIVDLHLELTERSRELSIQLRYNCDLYQAGQMRQFCRHLEETIRACRQDASQPLRQYTLTTNFAPEPAGSQAVETMPEHTILDLLRASVAVHQHRIAVTDDAGARTYGQLWHKANEIARVLIAQGLRPDECVGVLMPRSAGAIAAVLGILKAGGAYVPLDTDYPADRLRYVATDAELRILITPEAGFSAQHGLETYDELAVTDDWAVGLSPDMTVARQGHDLAYVLYTSGTTGMPKGVEIEHHSLADYVRTFADYFQIEANDCVVQQSSLTFDTSVEEIFPVLLRGGSIRVVRGGGQDIDGLVRAIDAGATVLTTTPLVLNELNREASRLANQLRLVISGGDVLRYDQVDALVHWCRVVNTYGPTESTVCVCYEEINPGESAILIGRPITNRPIAIVGADGQQQPVGVFGELWIGGAGVARGYRNKPDLTQKQFVTLPTGRFYRSGDWVRQREDGRLEFAGRRDNQIKIRGYRVELDEVEQVIGRCAGVHSAAVIVRDDASTRQLAAFYAGDLTEPALRLAIADTLPHYMVPAYLKRLETLPRTVSGKIDKTALQQLSLTPTPVTDVREQTHLERTIADIWAEVLGVASIQLTDNFFELGGHSIKGVRANHRVGQRLGLTVELAELFRHPTLAAFAACLAEKSRATYAAIRPVPTQPSYPVSPSQRSMWLVQQMNPESPAYTISFAIELSGPLDPVAFDQAWQWLIARHESLRTIFREDTDGIIRQVVLSPEAAGFAVQWIDVANQTDEAVEARIRALTALPFVLSLAPLLRVNVLTVNEHRRVLSVCVHHIVSDDWSASILLRELFGYYNQLLVGQQPTLNPLPIQYKDYTAWQQQQLTTDRMGAHRQFWQAQLAGELPVLNLPADAARPAVKGYAGASTTLTIDAPLTESIQALARANGLSEYMVWMGALNLLLFHYTGQRDQIVGCPVAGRDHPDLDGQIGCYINTLPLRVQLDENGSVGEFLHYVRQTMLAAYEHQAYPFAELADSLTLNRDPSRSLLFDVLLTLQNASDITGQPSLRQPLLHWVTAKPYNQAIDSCKFDWDIDIRPQGSKRTITVAFDRQLYSAARMERMLQHWIHIVEAICRDTTTAISALDYIGTDEKQQLLRWSEGETKPWTSSLTVVDLLKTAVDKYADRPAVADDHTAWTYRELWHWSNRLSNHLNRLAIRPDDCVGICLPRSVWTAAAMLGILKAGGAYVPLDMNYPAERLNYMVEDAGIGIILVAEAGTLARLGIQSGREVVVDELSLALVAATEPVVSLSANQLAYVLYTSGSTGRPKGVEIEHRSTVAFLAWCREEFAGADFDQALAVTSLNFDLSVFEFLYPLLVGKRVRVLESGLALPDYLPTAGSAKLLLNTVPSVVDMLLRTNVDLGSVTVLNMAGEPIGNYVRQRLDYGRMQVRNLYGPTEDTTYSTCFRLADADAAGLIGTPKTYSQAYVLGVGGQLQPMGVPGEICLAGAGLARGYRHRPELTQDRFGPHPFRPAERLYRTGDWGYWNEAGQLVCTGRMDNQVKLRGYRVELGEIERKIESAGAEQAVVLLAGADQMPRLVAFYQATSLSADALTAYLSACLPAWMIPQQFIAVVTFPQTLTGKIDRRHLLTMVPAADPVMDDTESWTPAERRMKPLWEAELGVVGIRRTDNFFQLGGHSLKATQLLARVRREWQQNVPLKTLFLYPTIAGLSHELAQAGSPLIEHTVPAQRPANGRYPLSAAQERVWLAHQLEGSGRSYHMPFSATLTGHLDTAAFQRAWTRLVARHESLRTVFRTNDSDSYQQVLDPETLAFSCPVYDLQTTDNPLAVVANALQSLVDEPFDLPTGPLLRVAVWQTGATSYELGVVFHHLICDGWSLGIIMREIFQTYNAYCQQKTLPLDPPTVQYGDYTIWERQHRQTADWEASRQYWLGRLSGPLPVLAFPASGPRRLARQTKAGEVQHTFDAPFVDQLDAFARQQNVSLYSLLLAGLNALLYRYTHQTDLIVGCAAAGREQEQWHQQVGLYVNTLALRNRFSGSDGFETLLAGVQQTVVDGYSHQTFGFDALIESLEVRHDAGRSPIFDLMFTLQQAEWDIMGHQHDLADLTFTGAAEPLTTPKYDLDITVSAARPERTIRVRFDQGLFTRDQIERFLVHYEAILTAVMRESQAPLSQLDYLSATEKQQLLTWGNPGDEPASAETITSLFARQVATAPGAIAIRDETSCWTYAELDTWSERVAGHLQQHNSVQTGEKVGLLTGRSAWAIVGMLAILKAGAAYVPIDSTQPEARIAFMLTNSAVRVLVTDGLSESKIAGLFSGEIVRVQHVPVVTPGIQRPDRQATPHQLAYVMYTSGSTGTPKGVLIEHRGVVRLVHQPNYITFGPTDRLLMTGALSFDATTFEIWGMLLNGGQLCIATHETLLDPGLLKQALQRWSISMMWMTAAWFDEVVDADPYLFAGLDWLLVGGDALSPPHVAKVNENFPHLALINGYGPTENTTFSLCHRIDRVGAGSIPIGTPIARSSVYIFDQHQQLVPVGVEGEIYLGGDGLARGYQNQPALTNEKFIVHPTGTTQRLYKTGDLGKWLPNGTVDYVGRVDNQVKIRGYRVELSEIERVLMAYPVLRQVAVLVESASADKQLVAYYVSDDPHPEGDLRLFLQRNLPAPFIPDRFVWVARMPLTPNGKTDREALRQLRAEPTDSMPAEPVTDFEQRLLEIWQEVLTRPLIRADDNFFDLGGHSLRATKLVTQLRKQLGITVPVSKIFQHPTVRSLAREISPALQITPADQTDQLLEEVLI